MEDITIELNFTPAKPGSTSGTLKVQHGEEILFIDTLNLAKDKARSQFIDKVREKYSGLDQNDLEKKLMRVADQELERGRKNDTQPPSERDNWPLYRSQLALEKTDSELVGWAKEFLRRSDLVSQIVEHARLIGVAGETELVVMIYLIGISRLLTRPLAGEVMGASSTGKSYTIRQIAGFFPDETVLQAHRITPRALEHMPPGSLVHRFVVAGERSRLQDDASAEATKALREMLSDGKLSLAIADKKLAGGLETKIIEQDGPIAYIESTTLGISQINDEDRTRFILLATDERREQTTAIIRQLAESVSNPLDSDIPDSIIALHHTVQRLLRPCKVVVPFAKKLITSLPLERLEVRRTFGHLISFIQAVALLHQYQRERNERGQIIATHKDYDVVRLYLPGPLARSLGCELTQGAKDLLEVVKERERFTIPDMVGETKLSDNTIRGRIKELQNTGQIIKVQDSKGQTAAVYAIAGDPPPLNGLVLPVLTETKDKNTYLATPELACGQSVSLCE